jgi:hypothetical protein
MALGLTALSPGAVLAAFPANLNLSTLDGTNGFRILGVMGGDPETDGEGSDRSGYAVGTAGDINGDGMDDLLIGALGIIRNRPGDQRFDGAVYVVFGGPGVGSTGTIELSALDGTNGFRIPAVAPYADSGRALSAAGDIDGDGIDDLLLGARNARPNGGSSGESYVVFGGAGVGSSGNFDLAALDGRNGFRIPGLASPDSTGFAVSTAGDVNGDGVPDLLIGAGGASPGGRFVAGAGYVVFGGAGVGSTGSFDLAALDGRDGFKLSGVAADDLAGRAVNEAGDVNGDGVDDVLIGAYGAGPNGIRSGASYVVFGGAGVGVGGNLELSALNGTNGFRLAGIAEQDFSGFALSTAGDINGDGVDDVLIGARYADPNGRSRSGESYVVFGGAGVGSGGNLELSGLNGTNGFRILGVAAGDLTGDAVSAVGDVNVDGFDDLLIGADGANPNGELSGASYVVFGAPGIGSGGTLELSALDGTNGFRISGVTGLDPVTRVGGDRSGFAVGRAGDVNGDNIPDLFIGAPFASPSGRFQAGESYVVFGRRPTLPPPPDPIVSRSPSARLEDTEPLALSNPRPFGCESANGEITCIETGGSTTPSIVFDVDIPAGTFFLQFEYTFTGGDGQIPSAGQAHRRGSVASPGDLGTILISNVPIAALPASTIPRPGVFRRSGQFRLSRSGRTTATVANYPSGATGSVFRVRNLRVDRCNQLCSEQRATICGSERGETLRGTSQNDVIVGRGGDDIIRGGRGNDLICGDEGTDRLVGGKGRDRLRGGTGNDTLLGGPGSDRLNGGLGRDVCDGGPGRDSASRCDTRSGIP